MNERQNLIIGMSIIGLGMSAVAFVAGFVLGYFL